MKKLLSSIKGWKDTFSKVGVKDIKIKPCLLNHKGKFIFPIMWYKLIVAFPKKSYEEYVEIGQLLVDILTNLGLGKFKMF